MVHHFTSVRHAQINGLVKATNKIIINSMKKRVSALGGRWVDKLENIMSVIIATFTKSTCEAPFRLGHGSEAVVLVKIVVVMHRVRYFNGKTMITSDDSSFTLQTKNDRRPKKRKGKMSIAMTLY